MTPQTEAALISALATIQANQKTHGDTLKKLDHAVNGNGKPGLVLTVDRHEQSLKWFRRVGWAVLAPALAALGVGLLGLAQAKQESPHEVPVPHSVPGPAGQSGNGASVQPVPGH